MCLLLRAFKLVALLEDCLLWHLSRYLGHSLGDREKNIYQVESDSKILVSLFDGNFIMLASQQEIC